MFIDHCDFCDELSDGCDNAFARIYKQQPRGRILYRSQHFVLLPSLGQIVEGHLLIVPTSHDTALADVTLSSAEELSELRSFVRRGMAETYGSIIFFEHGVRGKQAGGCGIDHAHLHAVPFASSREPIEDLKNRHPLKFVAGISEIPHQVAPDSSYLYYEQTNGQAWACEIDFVPSQYLRKCVAESLGTKSWDWRECGREEVFVRALERLSRVFNCGPEVIAGDRALSGHAKAANPAVS